MQHLLQLQQYLQAQQSLQSAPQAQHLGLSYSHPGASPPPALAALAPQVHHPQQYLYYNPSHIATPSNTQLNFFQHSSNTSHPQYFLSSGGMPDAQSLQFMPFASFIPPAQLQQQQQQQQQSLVMSSTQQQQQQQPSSQQQQPQPTTKQQPTQAKQQPPQQRPPAAAQQQQTTATTASPSTKPHEFIHQTPQQMHHSAPQYKRRFNLSRAPKENQKYVVVTEELLKMRQGDAAEKLNMKPSTLSKRWKNSLPERSWPYRTNQKLDKQIKKLQELQQKGYDVLSDLQKLSNLREENLRPAVIIINDKGDHKNSSCGGSNTVTSPPSNAASPPSNPTSPTTTSPPQPPFSLQQQAQQLPPQQLPPQQLQQLQELQNPLKYVGNGVKSETVGGGGLQMGNRPDQLPYMTPQQQQMMTQQRTMPNTLGSVKVETCNNKSSVVVPQQQQQYKNNTTQLEPDDAEEDDDDEEYEEEEDYDESGSGSPSD